MTTISSMDMTIGQFSVLTGLTPTALRLYDERGVLAPAVVDPVSGYRWYSTDQVRHGYLVGALREAGVPMAELLDLDTLDIDGYRERQQLRRLHEDVALRMAEVIRGISLAEWPVTAVEAAELAWVGTAVSMDVPEDGDVAAWLQMAFSLPQARRSWATPWTPTATGRTDRAGPPPARRARPGSRCSSAVLPGGTSGTGTGTGSSSTSTAGSPGPMSRCSPGSCPPARR